MRRSFGLPAPLPALALAACGDDDEASSGSPSRLTTSTTDGRVELESDPDEDLAYTTDRFTTKAQNGVIVVNFTNLVPETHDARPDAVDGFAAGQIHLLLLRPPDTDRQAWKGH